MSWKECCESKCKIDWEYLKRTYGEIDEKRLNYAMDKCFGIFVMADNGGGFVHEIPHKPEHCYPARGFLKELFGMKGEPIPFDGSFEYYVMNIYRTPFMKDELIKIGVLNG